MQLVHDVLDKLVHDAHGKPIGRVDGIVLQVDDDGEPPRVGDAWIGGTVLAGRVHARLAPVAAWIHRVVRGGEPTPTRIPVTSLSRDGPGWKAGAIDRRDTPAFAWELWLREHVVARFPGRGT
jgi:hypothetical protein